MLFHLVGADVAFNDRQQYEARWHGCEAGKKGPFDSVDKHVIRKPEDLSSVDVASGKLSHFVITISDPAP